MKRIILSAIITLSVIAVNAHDIDGDVLSSDRNHWTVTVAYDASIPGKWRLASGSFSMFKPGSGVSVGADYMLLIGKNFFFEPGMRLYLDNYRYEKFEQQIMA